MSKNFLLTDAVCSLWMAIRYAFPMGVYTYWGHYGIAGRGRYRYNLTIWKTCLEFPLAFTALIPNTCIPAAAVYPFWAFSVPLPSVLDIGSYLCLLLLSFPWLLRKCHQISIFFSSATWRIQSFLWPLPAGLNWYLFRDLLGLYVIMCSLQCRNV